MDENTNREKTSLVDLSEELKSVSNNLNLLACVVEEGINGDRLTPQGIGDSIFNACNHIDRIVVDMRDRHDG